MYNHYKTLKLAQSVGGFPRANSTALLSNPATTPDLAEGGVPLNSVDDINNPLGNTGGAAGVDINELLALLNKVSKSNFRDAGLQKEVQDMAQQVSTPRYAEILNNIAGALVSDPNIRTKDPSTGNVEETAKEMADKAITEINSTKTASLKQDYIKTSAKPEKDEDDTKKKKTRGNPFRVLMGQVGKLLDHGMSRKDIIKYLVRKKYWDEETIGRAVGIVKEYNRKKHTKKSSNSFNFFRYSQFIDNDQEELMNDVPFRFDGNEDEGLTPDWDKRSTSELIARAGWLKSAQSFTGDKHSEGRKIADSDGIDSQLKGIHSALTKRGFKEEEIP